MISGPKVQPELRVWVEAEHGPESPDSLWAEMFEYGGGGPVHRPSLLVVMWRVFIRFDQGRLRRGGGR